MIILGLTGSIGMGKSTASQNFRRLGVPVHDADNAVHIMMAKNGEAAEAIKEMFPAAVHKDVVDRQAIAAEVFADAGALSRIENILHPLVRLRERRFLSRCARQGRTLVVLVTESGIVENRIIQTPNSLPSSALIEATNFLSARLVGRTFGEAYEEIMTELEDQQAQLDGLTTKVVESGLATWTGGDSPGSLIVRGQAHLLDDVTVMADLEQIRALFAALETKEEMLKLLSLADAAEGVQIFIGADNELFNVAGCSMVVESFQNSSEQIVGAIGVIGPNRMNYGRIIPMVDYTAKLIGRLVG